MSFGMYDTDNLVTSQIYESEQPDYKTFTYKCVSKFDLKQLGWIPNRQSVRHKDIDKKG